MAAKKSTRIKAPASQGADEGAPADIVRSLLKTDERGVVKVDGLFSPEQRAAEALHAARRAMDDAIDRDWQLESRSIAQLKHALYRTKQEIARRREPKKVPNRPKLDPDTPRKAHELHADIMLKWGCTSEEADALVGALLGRGVSGATAKRYRLQIKKAQKK